MRIRTTCAALALLLGACAAPPALPPIRSGEAVAISVAMSPASDGVIRIRNEALSDGMTTGGGSGAVVGGLWGLTCGPFAVLCVPLGAAAGIIAGTAGGAAVGATGALSDQKAERVRSRLVHLQQAHPLLDELKRNISDRAQKYWRLNSGQPGTAVIVELQDLQLVSTRDERVRCVIRVLVSVQPGDGKQAAKPVQKLYEYVGPFGSLAVWLDEGNDFLDTGFTSASQQIAAQIVSDLAVK